MKKRLRFAPMACQDCRILVVGSIDLLPKLEIDGIIIVNISAFVTIEPKDYTVQNCIGGYRNENNP